MKLLSIILTLMLSFGAYAKVENIKTVKQAKKFLQTDKPVVIMFGADWCPACKNAMPHFVMASRFFEGKVKFAYFNEMVIKGVEVTHIPSYIAGKTKKDILSKKSFNKNTRIFVPDLVEFTTTYTGVEP